LGPGHYQISVEEEKPHSKVGLLGALSDRFAKNEINNNPGLFFIFTYVFFYYFYSYQIIYLFIYS
jgi:hypothetical protein